MTTRLAVMGDIPALRELIALSVRGLQAEDYSEAQREGALGTVFGVDSQLIADGTYFIVEDGAVLAACGGWSKRRTLFGSDQGAGREDALLDPNTENAKIRAFFVRPEYARRGLGSAILDLCERAASEAGFNRFEMGATLTGVKLYAARGYVAVEQIAVELGNGAILPVVKMEKRAVSCVSPKSQTSR